MRFELHIATDNAAFDDGRGGDYELARILQELSDNVSDGDVQVDRPYRLRDSNGNRVGYALWTGQPLPEPSKPPTVAVLVEVDPDGGADATVYLDDVEVTPTMSVTVDPGRGWETAEWSDARRAEVAGAHDRVGPKFAHDVDQSFTRNTDGRHIG